MGHMNYTLPDDCADWFEYHFNDTALRNDIYWRDWRHVIQKYLSAEQQQGLHCAICDTPLTAASLTTTEHVGGYQLKCCVRPCSTPQEQAMRKTVEEFEKNAAERAQLLGSRTNEKGRASPSSGFRGLSDRE
jgi:predicted sulfurtransferase